MLNESNANLYQALLRRDPDYDGRAFVGVTSTRVFCRLTCPARKPKLENCRFFPTAQQCMAAGFRPCKRCRPVGAEADSDPVIQKLLDQLNLDPSRRWREDDVHALGIDPSTARRAFQRHFGMTFLQFARMRLLGRAIGSLRGGGDVISAQLGAGFESGSGFRAAFGRLLGISPGSLSRRAELLADWIETPLGAMVAVADQRSLHLLEFIDRRALPRELGKPSAVRAVARANDANQLAIVIPCHRVIGADGSLTGYGGGLWRKQRLIELEQDASQA